MKDQTRKLTQTTGTIRVIYSKITNKYLTSLALIIERDVNVKNYANVLNFV